MLVVYTLYKAMGGRGDATEDVPPHQIGIMGDATCHHPLPFVTMVSFDVSPQPESKTST